MTINSLTNADRLELRPIATHFGASDIPDTRFTMSKTQNYLARIMVPVELGDAILLLRSRLSQSGALSGKYHSSFDLVVSPFIKFRSISPCFLVSIAPPSWNHEYFLA